MPHRSRCPINLAVEAVGDRWTLLILRDMIFAGRRHFREFLSLSWEGISPAILSDRLKRLVAEGFLTRTDDPAHAQKAIYSLTRKSVDLLPVIFALSEWGGQYYDADPELVAPPDMTDAQRAAALAKLRARLLRDHGIA